MAVSETRDLPDDIFDGEPVCWKNKHDGKAIWLQPDPRDEHDWCVAGPNSLIAGADSVEDAREKAKEFMDTTPRPSGMI